MFSVLLPFLFVITPNLPQPPVDVRLNQEFEVRVGETVTIKSEGLKINLIRVDEDSRCPEGVQCVWAGNGKVVLKLMKARKRAAIKNLNTNLDPKSAAYRGYDVKLVNLSPYPKKDVAIRKKEYVATLVVSRE